MKKIETKSVVLLQHHLKALKLPTILAECQKIASRCAADNVDHLGFLLQLCELELIDREKRAAERRLKAARFPTYKTLDHFDFTAQPSVNGRGIRSPALPGPAGTQAGGAGLCATIGALASPSVLRHPAPPAGSPARPPGHP